MVGSTRATRPIDEILSKREQQAMEVIHRRGEATAGDLYRIGELIRNARDRQDNSGERE